MKNKIKKGVEIPGARDRFLLKADKPKM